MRVQAKSPGGNLLATVDTVLPISGEASCKNCHADPMDPNFGGSRTSGPTDELESVGLPVVNSSQDPQFQAGNVPVDVAVEWATDINVLRLHDKKHGANYADFCDGSVSPCPPNPCHVDGRLPPLRKKDRAARLILAQRPPCRNVRLAAASDRTALPQQCQQRNRRFGTGSGSGIDYQWRRHRIRFRCFSRWWE